MPIFLHVRLERVYRVNISLSCHSSLLPHHQRSFSSSGKVGDTEVCHMHAHDTTWHHVIFYPQIRVKVQIDFLMKLLYDMIRGEFPLKLLDFINQRYVQNAKIYAVNHDLGFYPVKTQSSMSCGKPSCLKVEKQNPSLGGGRLFKSNRNNS